jgi:signal transduction histidine kinase
MRSILMISNWRVRTRLVAVLLVPIIAAMLFGGLRITSSLHTSTQLGQVQRLALLGQKVAALTQAMQAERDASAAFVAQHRQGQLANSQVDAAVSDFRGAAAQIDNSFDPVVRSNLTAVRDRLGDLGALRSSVRDSQLPTSQVISAYSGFISVLINLNDVISAGSNDQQVTQEVRTLSALARVKEDNSQLRAVIVGALTVGHFDPSQLDQTQTTQAAAASAMNDFNNAASPAERQLFEDTVTGPEVDQSERLQQTALARANNLTENNGTGTNGNGNGNTRTGNGNGNGNGDTTTAVALDIAPGDWFTSMTTRLNLIHNVENSLFGNLVKQTKASQANAQRSAVESSILVALILLLTLVATVLIGRSMVRPLHRLRSGALDVAGVRLPEMVRQLERSNDTADVNLNVKPINVTSTDEIGQVARAFDEVHSEAVRLAAEQAMLRGNVNSMFVNLSRRTQGLVQRQLRLIDDLEKGEQDPDQLSSLFKLDHLATRMRRNGENLLVLAGEEPGRRWSQPVPLIDVLRAAASEVEQYERIELRATPTIDIAGRSVNDVVHLVAELLENATSFSSPETRVVVTAQLLSGGRVMVEISDSGIGMAPAEMADANESLANPPDIDVAVSRRMGLFVVSRLAARHGLRIQLRRSSGGGITALVMVPASLVADHNEPAPVTPEQAAPEERNGARSRAGAQTAPEPDDAPTTEWRRDEAAMAEGAGNGRQLRQPGARRSPLPRPDEFFRQESEPPPSRSAGRRAGRRLDEPAEDDVMSNPRAEQTDPAATGPIAAVRSVTSQAVPGGGQHDAGPPSQPTSQPSPPYERARQENLAGSILDASMPLRSPENMERTPIYEAVESEWFRRRTTRGSLAPPPGFDPSATARQPAASPRSSDSWETGGGWQTGEQPSAGSATSRVQPIHPVRPGSGSEPAAPPPPAQRPAAAQAGPGPEDTVVDQGHPRWRSAGDEGWRAAESVRRPSASGMTTAGLPKRVPRANLVPGTATRPGAATSPPAVANQGGPKGDRSAEAVRGRLSSFQRGIQQGRDAGRDPRAEGLPPSGGSEGRYEHDQEQA